MGPNLAQGRENMEANQGPWPTQAAQEARYRVVAEAASIYELAGALSSLMAHERNRHTGYVSVSALVEVLSERLNNLRIHNAGWGCELEALPGFGIVPETGPEVSNGPAA
jgi:hypothetical protein